MTQLLPLVDAIAPINGKVGRTMRRPLRVLGASPPFAITARYNGPTKLGLHAKLVTQQILQLGDHNVAKDQFITNFSPKFGVV